MGAGFALGVNVSCTKRNGDLSGKNFAPNAWLTIDSAGTVTIIIAKSEMGQGVMTALPMIVAEELDVPWDSVSVSQADSPLDTAYGNQTTLGSGSVRGSWEPLRQAGAVAKTMLVEAAAKQWGTGAEECDARLGVVYHNGSDRSFKYSDLLDTAVKLPLPQKVSLKNPEDYHIVGKSVPRVDIHSKINGNAHYGADIKMPGLLTAIVAHCPVFGGTVASLDTTEALKVKGVRHIVPIETGAAVVADNFWSAQKGISALKINWNKPPSDPINSGLIRERFVTGVELDGVIAHTIGNPNVAQTQKTGVPKTMVVEADYELPFQAHATMEPMSCTADLSNGKYEVWAPTQSPKDAFGQVVRYGLPGITAAYEKIKRRLTGASLDSIKVHTTMLGCGFGRRLQQDYVGEAVQISKAVNAPVRLMWSREEDMQHDNYRPANFNRISAVLDDQGLPIVWKHKIRHKSTL